MVSPLDKQIFAFKDALDTDALLKAIQGVEHDRWAKTPADKRDAEPTLSSIRADYLRMDERGQPISGREILARYASTYDGESVLADLPTRDAGPNGYTQRFFTGEEPERIGAVLLRMEKDSNGAARPDIVTQGSDGKPYYLEPKEASAWLQALGVSTKWLPANEWAARENIGLTGHGTTLANGDESIYIETAAGQSRTVANGTVTQPLDGYYGGVVGTKVADNDLLDVYLSREAHDRIASGHPNTGNVFVMQQMSHGKPDELKVGEGFANVDAFQRAQASTWDKPADFVAKNQGAYIELDHAQYLQLKAALKDHPDLTLDQFVAQANLRMQDIARTPHAIQAPPTPAPAPTVAPAATAPAPAPAPVAPAAASTPPVGTPLALANVLADQENHLWHIPAQAGFEAIPEIPAKPAAAGAAATPRVISGHDMITKVMDGYFAAASADTIDRNLSFLKDTNITKDADGKPLHPPITHADVQAFLAAHPDKVDALIAYGQQYGTIGKGTKALNDALVASGESPEAAATVSGRIIAMSDAKSGERDAKEIAGEVLRQDGLVNVGRLISKASQHPNAGHVKAVEDFIYGDKANAPGRGDGKISETEITDALTTMQSKSLTAEGRAQIEQLRATLSQSGVSGAQSGGTGPVAPLAAGAPPPQPAPVRL